VGKVTTERQSASLEYVAELKHLQGALKIEFCCLMKFRRDKIRPTPATAQSKKFFLTCLLPKDIEIKIYF
jgi:hypothetical protein